MRTAGFESEASSQPSSDEPTVEPIPTDTAYMILKNRRRREVLRYLVGSDEVTTLDSLARHIAAKENGIDERALSSSQRKRVYIGLYQAHLPKMDDAGVIEFDKHRGRVELRPEAEQLFAYLDNPRDDGLTPGAYLAASVACGLLVGAGTLDVLAVPGLALLVVLGVGCVALHAAYTERLDGRPITTGGPAATDTDRTGERRSEPR